MRILHTSDLHANLSWLDWIRHAAPGFDLVSIAGDLLDASRPDTIAEQMREVSAAISRIPTTVAICSGNHDLVQAPGGDLPSGYWVRHLDRPGLYRDGDRFWRGNWSFYCHPWLLPPPAARDGDVWIIHAPPAGTATAQGMGGSIDHGDFEFGETCRSGRGPSIALCGHSHHPAAWHSTLGGTLVLNPGASSDPRIPAHIIIDARQWIATRHLPGVTPESIGLPGASLARRVLRRRTPEEIDSLLALTVSNQRAEGIHMTEAEIEESRRRLRRQLYGE